MMTTFIFVRHGQSLSNEEHVFAGHMDYALSPQGHKQAEQCAVFLKDHPITAIYTSDLARAKETAMHIASYHNAPLHDDKRLREIHAGVWQGETFSVLEKNPLYKRWYVQDIDLKPQGGESAQDVQKRTRAFMADVIKRHPGETVCVVTHSRALRTMDCDWHGIGLSALSTLSGAPNASISVVRVENGNFEILLYQDDSFQDAETRSTIHLE